MSASNSIVVGPLAQALAAKPQEERLPLLIEYLGSRSQAKIALATRVLTGCGSSIILLLIREAFTRSRRYSHAVRLLNIVGRIAVPVNLDDWMLLSAGQSSPSKLVSVECSRLLLQLGDAVASQEVSSFRSEGTSDATALERPSTSVWRA